MLLAASLDGDSVGGAEEERSASDRIAAGHTRNVDQERSDPLGKRIVRLVAGDRSVRRCVPI